MMKFLSVLYLAFPLACAGADIPSEPIAQKGEQILSDDFERSDLGDDQEGVMRNDIFEIRRDAARKTEADRLIEGRGTAVPTTIESGEWYQVSIEIAGDQMRVSLNGKAVGYLRSPGIAHETKSSFHFTVNGPGVLFDDVSIWNAL